MKLLLRVWRNVSESGQWSLHRGWGLCHRPFPPNWLQMCSSVDPAPARRQGRIKSSALGPAQSRAHPHSAQKHSLARAPYCAVTSRPRSGSALLIFCQNNQALSEHWKSPVFVYPEMISLGLHFSVNNTTSQLFSRQGL